MIPNFWQLATTPILKIKQIHLTTVFLAKNISNFVSLSEKSTTGIAIL